MNLRQLAYGVLSRLPGVPPSLYRNTVEAWPVEYSYAVWLRHLILAHNGGLRELPEVVAELGPGGSIGVGLAALISGARRYYAFDAIEHAKESNRTQQFDELVMLFMKRARVPGQEEFPEMSMTLDDKRFPSSVLNEEWLASALDPQRLSELRVDVEADPASQDRIVYKAPWERGDQPETGTVDLIVSQAVLEHVPDITVAYEAMYRWLRPGGMASHQIDFRSHGLFSQWDGHWACPDWLWSLFVGKRGYLLNRLPLSSHIREAKSAGFEVSSLALMSMSPKSSRLTTQFASMSIQDRTTASCYLLLRKP